MRKIVLMMAAILSTSMAAQEVKVAEPEFVGSYCILTSDSTYETLPKENGSIGKHKNKARKIAGIIGGASQVVGGLGILGLATRGGSYNGYSNAMKTIRGASAVGSIAGATNALAGAEGMDIVFSGGKSAYTVTDVSKGLRLVVKGESNDTDPMDCYRIVRFNASKKERRVQWMEFSPALLGSKEVADGGYINFVGRKYGEQSYLIEIPASELTSGEYGVFYLSIATALSVPVGTFSVR